MSATPPALADHLRAWLGASPPASASVHVVGTPARLEPGWDGRVARLRGVIADDGRTVLAVTPDLHRDVAGLVHGHPVEHLHDPVVRRRIADVVGGPGSALGFGVLRWATEPDRTLAAVGQWLEHTDPRVPAWLQPFGHEVLVVLDEDGAYAAGLGVKRHSPAGWEVAVGTESSHRGTGLARRLVATAARRCLEQVPIVTYHHDPENVASARVAAAAGFPDRGWRLVGVWGGTDA